MTLNIVMKRELFFLTCWRSCSRKGNVVNHLVFPNIWPLAIVKTERTDDGLAFPPLLCIVNPAAPAIDSKAIYIFFFVPLERKQKSHFSKQLKLFCFSSGERIRSPVSLYIIACFIFLVLLIDRKLINGDISESGMDVLSWWPHC